MNASFSPAHRVQEVYRQRFGTMPRLFMAPGRVNLIGEHTDYNEGFVLPAAINKRAWLAIGPSQQHSGNWISLDLDLEASVSHEVIQPHAQAWVNYLLGIVDQFQRKGIPVPPLNLVLGSDIPVGAGLSSSAALESVMAVALNAFTGAALSSLELARIAQKSENQFIGLQCGIMDMFASIHGREDHAMRIDCRDLRVEYFPLDLGEYKIVLMDTGVRHSLASSEYNLRRQQCEAGVALIRRSIPSVKSLREVSLEMLEEFQPQMDPLIYQRCAYVISENGRVEAMCRALETGNLAEAGSLLYASHEGLQHHYGVSCDELDLLVDLVRPEAAVLGSRMMGGGFGGCTISIMHKDAIAGLERNIGNLYHHQTGKTMRLYDVVTGDGAREIHQL